MKKNYVKKVVLTSLLIALNVIMERFMSYNVWNMSIGFSFITIAFAAVFLGIPYAVAVGAFGDIIGALLFPFGTYFFGFTLTNILMALTTGIFLYKRPTYINIALSTLIKKVLFTLILNSVWISILYNDGLDAFSVVMMSRLPTAAITLVIEIFVTSLLFSEKSAIKKTLSKNIKF